MYFLSGSGYLYFIFVCSRDLHERVSRQRLLTVQIYTLCYGLCYMFGFSCGSSIS